MAEKPGMMRVRAVEGRHVPLVDAQGRTVLDRFAGWDAKGARMSEGEWVPQNMYYAKYVNRGALEVIEDGGAAKSVTLDDAMPQGVRRLEPGEAERAQAAVRDSVVNDDSNRTDGERRGEGQ